MAHILAVTMILSTFAEGVGPTVAAALETDVLSLGSNSAASGEKQSGSGNEPMVLDEADTSAAELSDGDQGDSPSSSRAMLSSLEELTAEQAADETAEPVQSAGGSTGKRYMLSFIALLLNDAKEDAGSADSSDNSVDSGSGSGSGSDSGSGSGSGSDSGSGTTDGSSASETPDSSQITVTKPMEVPEEEDSEELAAVKELLNEAWAEYNDETADVSDRESALKMYWLNAIVPAMEDLTTEDLYALSGTVVYKQVRAAYSEVESAELESLLAQAAEGAEWWNGLTEEERENPENQDRLKYEYYYALACAYYYDLYFPANVDTLKSDENFMFLAGVVESLGGIEGLAPIAQAFALANPFTLDGTKIYANGEPIEIQSGGIYYQGTLVYASNSSYEIYGGSKDDDVASTSVTMKGGTVQGIFGGGENGKVTGDTSVVISGGTVRHSVMGGGAYATATVGGNASVTISGGTFGAMVNTTAICGGGYYGAVEGDTTVTIQGGTFYADIFGGGDMEDAVVGGSSKVVINGGSFNTDSNGLVICGGGRYAPVNGNSSVEYNYSAAFTNSGVKTRYNYGLFDGVYGGGLLPSATVGGDSSVSVGGSTAFTATVIFAGGGYFGDVAGNSTLSITNTNLSTYIGNAAFGGGFRANVGGAAGVVMDVPGRILNVTNTGAYGLMINGNVFGGCGGDASQTGDDATRIVTCATSSVKISGGRVNGRVVGGSAGSGTTQGLSYVEFPQDGNATYVYRNILGAGLGAQSAPERSGSQIGSYVKISHSISCGGWVHGGTDDATRVLGASADAPASAYVSIDSPNFYISLGIRGAGLTPVYNSHVEINGYGTVGNSVSGGSDSSPVLGSSYVNIKNTGGTLTLNGTVYGGCSTGSVAGNTHVEITNAQDRQINIGNTVYGGSVSGSVGGDSYVKITANAASETTNSGVKVSGNVFGGTGGSAGTGDVAGKAHVELLGTGAIYITSHVFGSTDGANVGTNYVNTDEAVSWVIIDNNNRYSRCGTIYGGSNTGLTGGGDLGASSYVYFRGGAATSESTTATADGFLVSGAIYGGGYGAGSSSASTGRVYSSHVTIAGGGRIIGAVYGGGAYLNTRGQSYVEIGDRGLSYNSVTGEHKPLEGDLGESGLRLFISGSVYGGSSGASKLGTGIGDGGLVSYVEINNAHASSRITGDVGGSTTSSSGTVGDPDSGYGSAYVRIRGQITVSSNVYSAISSLNGGFVEVYGGTLKNNVVGGSWSGKNYGDSYVKLHASDYNITIGDSGSSTGKFILGGNRNANGDGPSVDGTSHVEILAENGKTVRVLNYSYIRGVNEGAGSVGTTYAEGPRAWVDITTDGGFFQMDGGNILAFYGNSTSVCNGDSYVRLNARQAADSIYLASYASANYWGTVMGKAYVEVLGHGAVKVNSGGLYGGGNSSGRVGGNFENGEYVSWVVIDNDNPSSYVVGSVYGGNGSTGPLGKDGGAKPGSSFVYFRGGAATAGQNNTNAGAYGFRITDKVYGGSSGSSSSVTKQTTAHTIIAGGGRIGGNVTGGGYY